MIEETAVVIAIEGDQALLQTQRRSACQSCSVKQGCGTSVLAKVVGARSSQISVDNSLQAKVGDEVLLGIQENALVRGSLLVYALPLLMMLVFALLGEGLGQWLGWQHELLIIVFALLGLLGSGWVIRYGLHRSALKQQIQPHMLRIVSPGAGRRDIMLAP